MDSMNRTTLFRFSLVANILARTGKLDVDHEVFMGKIDDK